MTSDAIEVQIAKIIADCCRAARNAALEEAAVVAAWWDTNAETAEAIAAAIRARALEPNNAE